MRGSIGNRAYSFEHRCPDRDTLGDLTPLLYFGTMPADGVEKYQGDETHSRAPTEEEHTNSTSQAFLHTAPRSKRGMR